MNIVIADTAKTEITRSYTWDKTIPTAEAGSWGCKYVIKATDAVVTEWAAKSGGYIFLQVETYGFDSDVFLIIQERGKYVDWKTTDTTNVPKIYKVYFGTKFYMPVEYDLMLFFEPTSAESGEISNSGKIRLRAWG